jgi:Lipid A 3-O-deacylase (PagL)
MRVRWAVLCLGVGLRLFTAQPIAADELRPLNVALRAGVTGPPVLGGEALEHFQQYDVSFTAGLPWSWYSESGWGVGTRLMTSVGALYGGGDTAFLTTLVPGFFVGPRDSVLSFDLGGGAALLSRHEFGSQDFGGNFQFVLTFGLTLPVPFTKNLGVGYRFHHMSDWGLYHSAKGVDVHMLEITYKFR